MISILGIKINRETRAEALQLVKNFLDGDRTHFVFTPNPEMIVDAQSDAAFKNILNRSDLNICDGFGLKLVAPQLTKIAGVDFMHAICALAAADDKSVYLFGAHDDHGVQKAAVTLTRIFPTLRIVGVDPGYTINLVRTEKGSILEYNRDEHDEAVHRIIMAAPDILFVALGHHKQEKWIDENAPHIPGLKIAMGVGGAFDYLSGKVQRAPKFLQTLGLEWLWRLAHEPRRVKRIWKATTVFLFYVFFKKNAHAASK